MKWVLNASLGSMSKYSLLHNDEPIAELKYDAAYHSIRLGSTGKRLFFIGHAGLFNNRRVIKNEYGFIIGEDVFQKQNNMHILKIGTTNYVYVVKDNFLTISNGQKEVLLQCEMPEVTTNYLTTALIFGVSWFLLSQAVPQTSHVISS